MNNVNYQAQMDKIISANASRGDKKRLLLHCCCAPCASYVITYLKDYFDITAYYFNPNITDADEYNKRLLELEGLCARFDVKVVDGGYSADLFFSAVKGFEDEIEGGARCSVCYALRLDATAYLAKKEGFDYFCSTLSISPLKNAKKLNDVGFALAKKYGVTYLPNDFKKKNGYLKSVELSKEYGLYRQNYCGCEFSKRRV